MSISRFLLVTLLLFACCPLIDSRVLLAAEDALGIPSAVNDAPPPPGTAHSEAAASAVGERIPSDDSGIKDFHSLGLVNGCTNIFRSASPARDLVDSSGKAQLGVAAEVKKRLERLHDLGIRTIISFENPEAKEEESSGDEGKAKRIKACVALEKAAAAEVGINYVSHPLANSGKDSFETMSDEATKTCLDSAVDEIFKHTGEGGVLFHCSAGHDRTGITTAYMRMKYQHWPVDEAIDEMRRLGHNWPKFSHNGGVTSWHEDHLRAIEKNISASVP